MNHWDKAWIHKIPLLMYTLPRIYVKINLSNTEQHA